MLGAASLVTLSGCKLENILKDKTQRTEDKVTIWEQTIVPSKDKELPMPDSIAEIRLNSNGEAIVKGLEILEGTTIKESRGTWSYSQDFWSLIGRKTINIELTHQPHGIHFLKLSRVPNYDNIKQLEAIGEVHMKSTSGSEFKGLKPINPENPIYFRERGELAPITIEGFYVEIIPLKKEQKRDDLSTLAFIVIILVLVALIYDRTKSQALYTLLELASLQQRSNTGEENKEVVSITFEKSPALFITATFYSIGWALTLMLILSLLNIDISNIQLFPYNLVLAIPILIVLLVTVKNYLYNLTITNDAITITNPILGTTEIPVNGINSYSLANFGSKHRPTPGLIFDYSHYNIPAVKKLPLSGFKNPEEIIKTLIKILPKAEVIIEAEEGNEDPTKSYPEQ